MKTSHSYTIIVSLLLFTSVFLAPAIVNAQTGNETFRHITSRDGLSSGFVWQMMEDDNGYIWIASNVGLDKYDGYSVTSYRNDPSNPTTISGGAVFNIFDDGSGRFWIATGSGLSIMDPVSGTFNQIHVSGDIPQIRVARSIQQADNGDTWIGDQNGIHRIGEQDFSADTLITEYFRDSSLDSMTAVNALEINGQTLWVATDSNLHKFDLSTNEFVDLPEFNEDVEEVITGTIWDLLVDSNGTLWISSNAGLAKWEEGRKTPEVIKSLGPYDEEVFTAGFFQALTEDYDKNLWISTGYIGAIRYNLDSGDVKTYRHDPDNVNTIQEDDVHYAFTDRSGNTWFGYHNIGLSLMYSQAWTYTYNLPTDEYESDHPVNFVHSYLEDSDGNGWLATHWGLGHISADDGSFRYFPIYPDKLSEDDNENELESIGLVGSQIFALTHSNEVHVFNLETETFQQATIPESIPDVFFISTTFSSNDNYFYLGAAGTDKLLRIDRSTLEASTLDAPRREQDSSVQQTAVFPLADVEGNIFIRFFYAYPQGIEWDTFHFDPSTESFTKLNVQSPDGIAVFGAPSVSSTQSGVIWSISNIGLLREDLINQETQLYFESDVGVLNETNRLMVSDNDGFIWISNLTGITRLDPVTETISYFETDPARKPEAYLEPTLAENGDIIFGGEGGYTRFNPNDLTNDSPIQSIFITELWAGSEILNITNDGINDVYEMDHDENNISVSYIGLNYRDPNYTRYRYRLSGYDDEWNNVGTQRRVFLANLPPGDYTFQVQAAQRFGGFSENTAEISLSILPPWWQTIPAYIGFFMLFIGGVVVADRVQRKRVIRKERERSREKELEQAKEIEKAYKNLKAAQEQLVQQEKLASLGQLTAGIAHEIKNPLNFVNNFSDLSIELVKEVQAEVTSVRAYGDTPQQDEALDEIEDILNDIETNLRKIHEHGSRADSIVKSMLQHSRGGSNKLEPTDLNALIKEYSNLAFHGMRAGKKPINVDIKLELDKKIGEVPMIAEDFSRVILNLCNNAFDAMHEKLTTDGDKGYEPKLTISTRKKGAQLIVEVEDNGPGIPDQIKDKILQPFFTTKKGTEGTGLGLSITHDIVKAHGGSIEILSKDEGTIMKVILHNS